MSQYERAEIRRVHRDGTATVEYIKSGKTEKRVAKLKHTDRDERDDESPPRRPPECMDRRPERPSAQSRQPQRL
ncbi:hypothetical protein SPRG_20882 [Saprolegnia parasitica CBS 223.65]|uniref:Uncharacterized protein n=1 Tax=Saprolegnia parasitica (strain CBS 223.65) TaxID=695850 RepID=A0A067C412_SAPPC|nr:hypothetical protein SPRG_20882 [Saprolegnia parasitica CBS 223.65]KDO23880.1 hypothetical protein SPRG_20882 [Saprolegnia parasitica CBS 223.65]|eukprot:XP_012205410.1 hypothetical protein SPRG_20882 [Saprolegnia parasitica CBS 223.65]